jgi:hypothetical protein
LDRIAQIFGLPRYLRVSMKELFKLQFRKEVTTLEPFVISPVQVEANCQP